MIFCLVKIFVVLCNPRFSLNISGSEAQLFVVTTSLLISGYEIYIYFFYLSGLSMESVNTNENTADFLSFSFKTGLVSGIRSPIIISNQ